MDLSGVAATVFGVVPAFGELCPALSVAALSTTFEPALLKGVKNFSFSGGIRGPWEILLGSAAELSPDPPRS